jgi:DNA recombination protein RmuC
MPQAAIAAIALLAGTLLGYWMRTRAANSEKALLDQRNREATDALAAVQSQLAAAQSESAARAGFESVAVERAGTIGRLTAERDATRRDLETSHSITRDQAARISQLEADLANERQNMAEKIALLETAKQSLAHQFEALAANILEQKSKDLLRRQPKRARKPSRAAQDADRGFQEKGGTGAVRLQNRRDEA